jgi:hypothetical protein
MPPASKTARRKGKEIIFFPRDWGREFKLGEVAIRSEFTLQSPTQRSDNLFPWLSNRSPPLQGLLSGIGLDS